MSDEHSADYDARCTGTGCPGCEAARRHYKATGCLVAGCPGGHGRVIPPALTCGHLDPDGCGCDR